MKNPSLTTAFPFSPNQPVPASPVHKRIKQDRQIDNIVCYFTNIHINNGSVFLRKNIVKTKYVIWGYEIIPFGGDRLKERIKADTYFQTGEQITDKVIDSALQIISGQQAFWLCDTEEERVMPIRTMPLPGGGFTYFFNRMYPIRHNNSYLIRTYAPKGMVDIPFPVIPDSPYQPLDSDYHSSFGFKILNDLICNKSNIPEDSFILILTWCVQCISSSYYTLLELVGEPKTGKSFTQSVLRELIDPHVDLMAIAPKKLKDLERHAMNGHVMSYDHVDDLSDDVQVFMADLMSVNGVKITTSTGIEEFGGDIFVRRPICLNSVIPVVTNEKLLSKTLTIELMPSVERSRNYKRDPKQVYDARLELLKLSMAVANFNNTQDFPRCTYLDLHDFAEIGMKLSKIIYNTTEVFENQLNITAREQTLASLEENSAGNLVYLWAISNPNTDKEMSALDWIEELSAYQDDRSKQLSITPRKLGSDLKRAAPTLRKLGIDCNSPGKRGSHVKWRIITAEKIELQDNFFEANNCSSSQSGIKEQTELKPENPLDNCDAIEPAANEDCVTSEEDR